MNSRVQSNAAGRPASRLSPSRQPPSYATPQGCFVDAAPAAVQALSEHFLQTRREGLTRAPPGEVSRVETHHLAVGLDGAGPRQLARLRERGAVELSKVYCLTSGAGLWNRGGGQVKAIVPFNLAQLLSARKMRALDAASDLLNASSPADVLLIARVDVKAGQTVEQTAARVVSGAKRQIDEILLQACTDPHDRGAFTPLVMKFVQLALASEQAGTYVPFDVWTSPQTHGDVHQHNEGFKAHFEQLPFHPDRRVQSQVVGALREYFVEAQRHGDTHLFGYQVGYPAFDAQTGAPLLDTPRIGEGAGMAKAYLDQSGRTAQLLERGKECFVFENIEVLNDLPLLFGAHAQTEKEVSVVLVPQREGYAGGNPFQIEKDDGTTNLELHEQSALPEQFRHGNAYFNTNTIVQPLRAQPPRNIGYEIKSNGTQARAKINAGDITQELPTGGIGGRIGQEFENVKTYPDYDQNGVPLVETYRAQWAELFSRR